MQFLFNAEFDFELRNSTISPQISTAVESMAPLFSPALSEHDGIISTTTPDPQFYVYLQSLGIPHAELILPNQAKSGHHSEAWGWSESSLKKIRSFGGTITAPKPSVCRFVNSREFAHTVNKKHGLGVPNSQSINTKCGLLKTLGTTPFHSAVLKPFFGNSGAGFLFLNEHSSAEDLQRAEQLVQSEPVIIEPWLPRISDIASLFRIEPDGTVEIIGHHRNICNSSGSFYGTMIFRNDPEISRWLHLIEPMIHCVAKELFSTGYFGLVSIDSFSYDNSGGEEIALCVDINCRYTMSYIAHMLNRKIESPALFYRFIARKRHTLPDAYEELLEKLKGIHFSRESKRGVFLASPLRITGTDGVTRQPLRSAFCIAGENVDDVLGIDDQLRDRVLKPKRV